MATRGGNGPLSAAPNNGGNKKKEVKKSSYYVWFLGAKESQGLRGENAVRPALDFLLDQERQNEPSKVTLQVSNKGMKILQNVPGRGGRGRPETIKHFIPRDAITWVVQEPTPDDDLIATILLLYNPATRCPVHVHGYRCDSVDTATMLRRSLETLVERPEQQRRLASLESGLAAKGARGPPAPSSQQPGSDGRSTRGDSESSGSEREFASSSSSPPIVIDRRTAHLYANLAAELREKLGGGGSNRSSDRMPLLLPPRDYDTMHRSKGKLDNIDSRRCMQVSVVGPNGVFSRRLCSPTSPTREIGNIEEEDSHSSGRSSGIGSEEAPSSPLPLPHVRPFYPGRKTDHHQNHDNKPSVHRHQHHTGGSSSDEEWEAQRQMHTRALLQWEKRSSEGRDRNSYSQQAPTPQHQRVVSPRREPVKNLANEWPRVLPRVQTRSPVPKAYQELPEEKRYPGLDRETARTPAADPNKPRRPSFNGPDKERPLPQPQRPARFSYTDPSSAYRFAYSGRGK